VGEETGAGHFLTWVCIVKYSELEMKKWSISLFLLFTLASGVLAGMPLRAGNMDSGMMACCVKAKSNEQSAEANAARVCCAVKCTDPAPTSPSGSFNFAPANLEISKAVAERISALFKKEKTLPRLAGSYSRKIYPRIFQPKYIQNNSFLI
jgi:hypothetical protein